MYIISKKEPSNIKERNLFSAFLILLTAQVGLIVIPSILYSQYLSDLNWGYVVGVFGGMPYAFVAVPLMIFSRKKVKLPMLSIRSWLRGLSFVQVLLFLLSVCAVVFNPEILQSKQALFTAAFFMSFLSYFLIGETFLLVTVEKEYELIFVTFIGFSAQFLAISYLTLESLSLLQNHI